MKALLDMPVSPDLLRVLQAHGHEGVHAHQIGKDRAAECGVDKRRIRITQLPLARKP